MTNQIRNPRSETNVGAPRRRWSHRAAAPARPLGARSGFTLVELLVVMGIILVIISLLMPAIVRAHRNALRISMRADINAISQALDVYKTQFGDYPRPTSTVNGSEILCWALVAPGPLTEDGADGPGFRIRNAQGKVHGPYLSMDHFQIGLYTQASATATPSITAITNGVFDDKLMAIGDRYNVPILYFVRNPAANLTASLNSYVGVGNYNGAAAGQPAWNVADCQFPGNASTYAFTNGVNDFATFMPGCTRPPLTSSQISVGVGTVAPQFNLGSGPCTLPYILWCAGPDGRFGTSTDNSTSDDVTNFQ